MPAREISMTEQIPPSETVKPLDQWSCNEVLIKDNNIDLTDILEPEKYPMSLLWHNDDQDPKPICLPPKYILLIDQIQDRNGYKFMSEPFRKLVFHGIVIYDRQNGNRLHDLMMKPKIQNAIERCDKDTLDRIIPINCNFLSKRCTSVRFSEDLYKMIDDRRKDAGVCTTEKFIVYLVTLSLRRHTRYTGWYPDFDIIIDDMERQISNKIKSLETI